MTSSFTRQAPPQACLPFQYPLYTQYAYCANSFNFRIHTLHITCPDDNQSQIAFNKTTWNRSNTLQFTRCSIQTPVTFSLSHVTSSFTRLPPLPSIPIPAIYTICLVREFVQFLNLYPTYNLSGRQPNPKNF